MLSLSTVFYQRRLKEASFHCASITGMFGACALIMSLMIVKVSTTVIKLQSLEQQQNFANKFIKNSEISTHQNSSTVMELQTILAGKRHKRQSHVQASENAFLLERDEAISAAKVFDEETHMKSANASQLNAALSLTPLMTRNKHMRSDLPEEIQPTTHLTSRRPSFLIRRPCSQTPSNNCIERELRPSPFHFPYDGPMPEKFRKPKAERTDVNNIQDILQKLQLSEAEPPLPPMMMLPTSLHVAGSFKNLKSSGIKNFFKSKRNKNQVQRVIPIPIQMPLYDAYATNMYTAIQTPHQRIAMDQFYPFKPRSPNDINLLAMQQSVKQKKKRNKLLLHHSSTQLPYAVDPHAALYSRLMAYNFKEKPKLKPLPFNVNLDIFPVMPPIRNAKAAYSALKPSYAEYNAYGGMQPSAAAYYPVFKQMKHSANMPQYNSKVQQQQQLQKQQLVPAYSQQQQQCTANDCSYPANSKANPIMVHLNVFPKSGIASKSMPSTNSFYNPGYNPGYNPYYKESEPVYQGSPNISYEKLNESTSTEG